MELELDCGEYKGLKSLKIVNEQMKFVFNAIQEMNSTFNPPPNLPPGTYPSSLLIHVARSRLVCSEFVNHHHVPPAILHPRKWLAAVGQRPWASYDGAVIPFGIAVSLVDMPVTLTLGSMSGRTKAALEWSRVIFEMMAEFVSLTEHGKRWDDELVKMDRRKGLAA